MHMHKGTVLRKRNFHTKNWNFRSRSQVESGINYPHGKVIDLHKANNFAEERDERKYEISSFSSYTLPFTRYRRLAITITDSFP